MGAVFVTQSDQQVIVAKTGAANKLASAIQKYAVSDLARSWLDKCMEDFFQRFPKNINGVVHYMPLEEVAKTGGNHMYANNNRVSNIRQPEAYAEEPYVEDVGGDQRSFGLSRHIYGRDMAICLSEGQTKKGGDKTLFLEGAKGANRQFNWGNKITICTTILEHPVMYGVLIGAIPECTFSNHGQTNKSFDIKNQGGNFYISLREKGKEAIGVRVSLADGLYLSSMLFNAINHNTGGISRAELADYIHNVIAPGMQAAKGRGSAVG